MTAVYSSQVSMWRSWTSKHALLDGQAGPQPKYLEDPEEPRRCNAMLINVLVVFIEGRVKLERMK